VVKMKNKLVAKYRETVGEPKLNSQNLIELDLWHLGAVDPQFAAAQALDALLHNNQIMIARCRFRTRSLNRLKASLMTPF
jgi:hypothetical protein